MEWPEHAQAAGESLALFMFLLGLEIGPFRSGSSLLHPVVMLPWQNQATSGATQILSGDQGGFIYSLTDQRRCLSLELPWAGAAWHWVPSGWELGWWKVQGPAGPLISPMEELQVLRS